MTDAPYHEHPDCILICMQWLAAQRRTARPARTVRPIQHLIEAWAGRYVSRHDVIEAARRLNIGGHYPLFAIDSRLVLPDVRRLANIGEAMTQLNYIYALEHQTCAAGPYGPYASAESGRTVADEVAARVEAAGQERAA